MTPNKAVRQMLKNAGDKPAKERVREIIEGLQDIVEGKFTVYTPQTLKSIKAKIKRKARSIKTTPDMPSAQPDKPCWRCNGKKKVKKYRKGKKPTKVICQTCNGTGAL